MRLSVENGKGTYLSGPIRLASHIRLQIDKGAIFDGRDAPGNLAAMLTALRITPAAQTAASPGGTA